MENQENGRKVTVREVITITREMLARIPVPAGLIRQIGEPVAAAIENLSECLKAMERDQAAKEAEEAGAVPLIDLDAEEGNG